MSETPRVQLGRFELLEPRGAGSVATVWRAQHVRSGVAAAVKVIIREKARRADYQERFRREVRSHARLNHPGIVTVFDYGEIGERAEVFSGGELVAGSPYLVMEYTEGGTVGREKKIRDWFTLRSILMQVLDGLAHAHARRVVHRDLKPENILWFPEGNGGRFKISDFGIAHAFSSLVGSSTEDLRDAVAGTPYYMPPEQLAGDWREVGPWSDLYAVGCVAFEIVGGERPFGGGNLAEVAGQKFSGHIPELSPTFPVPDSFVDWLERLLSKEPRHRFRRAADAAWALKCLPARAAPEAGSSSGSAETDRLEWDDGTTVLRRSERADRRSGTEPEPVLTTIEVGEPEEDEGSPASDTLDLGDMSAEKDRDRPPFPRTWTRGGELRGARTPSDIGLGLFGIREVPFVDRDAERDLIWYRLREVVDASQVRAIEFRGASGAGKSRLIRWMARRADELGVATWLRASHSKSGDRSEGLSAMVETALKAWELDRQRTFQRVQDALAEITGWADRSISDERLDEQARALTEIVVPTPSAEAQLDGPRYHFASATERLDAVAQLVAHFSAERPVILWIDDAQWGSDGVALVEHLFEHRPELPVLVLLSTEEEALEGHGSVSEQLDRLAARDRYQRMELGPLAVRDRAVLINRMLPLEPKVAQKALQQTAGLPLFAIQLVGDWVDRGLLEPGRDGYGLRDEGELTSPGSLREIWDPKIERVIERVDEERSEPTLVALELAATLGSHVDAREWREACRLAGVPARPDLVDELVRDGLVWPREHGFEFVHDRLGDLLRESAREAGRFHDHHRRAARALESVYAGSRADVQERRVDHLLSAGELGPALQPMIEIANHFYTLEQYRDVERILDRRAAVVESLELPEDDRHRIENLELRARISLVEGEWDRTAELLERVIDAALEHQWSEVLGFAHITRAMLAHDRGDFFGGLRSLRTAKRELEKCDHLLGLARAHRARAAILRRTGDFRRARREYEAASDLYTEIGFEAARIDLQNYIGYTLAVEGDLEGAESYVQLALDHARRIGSTVKEGRCWRHLGELDRFRADWDRARERYRRAIQAAGGRGDAASNLIRFKMALTEIGAEQFGAASGHLDGFERGRFDYLETSHDLARACLDAHDEEWLQFDADLERAETRLAEGEGIERDDAWLAEKAGRLAGRAGERRRARRALELASDRWMVLGDTERAGRCRRRRAELGGSP